MVAGGLCVECRYFVPRATTGTQPLEDHQPTTVCRPLAALRVQRVAVGQSPLQDSEVTVLCCN